MTRLAMNQLAEVWYQAGGSKAGVVSAVAVAMAESGGNTDAISPAADYGLWQINITNWASQGLNTSNWMDPLTNARVAVRMSGNGTNWAAWCTAWVDPRDNCGHGYLPAPQLGSPAGSYLAVVSAGLSIVAALPGLLADHTGIGAARNAWGGFQRFVGPYAEGHRVKLSTVQRQTERLG